MSRLRSSARWGQLALLLSLLLSGCATRPVGTPQTLSADQERSFLQGLAGFTFTARVRISGQGSMPTMEWRQQHGAAKVRLSTLLGMGGLQLEYNSGHLRLATSRGEKLDGQEAEAALANAIGFVPPFDSLRYWVLGVPAPEATPPAATFDANGLLQRLQQQDWTISYESRRAITTATGVVHLPHKLLATNNDLKVTLVIDRWSIE